MLRLGSLVFLGLSIYSCNAAVLNIAKSNANEIALAEIQKLYDKWENPQRIPYRFDDRSYSAQEKELIEIAMSRISADMNKCIVFQEYSDKDVGQDHIYISKTLNSGTIPVTCFSFYGRLLRANGQGQKLALIDAPNGCMNSVRDVMKFLANTLGLRNEYNRPDRDEHIKVYEEHLQPILQTSNILTKYAADAVEYNRLPFDYQSITFSDASQWAVENKVWYEFPANRSVPRLEHLSHSDCLGLSWLYGCDESKCVDHYAAVPAALEVANQAVEQKMLIIASTEAAIEVTTAAAEQSSTQAATEASTQAVTEASTVAESSTEAVKIEAVKVEDVKVEAVKVEAVAEAATTAAAVEESTTAAQILESSTAQLATEASTVAVSTEQATSASTEQQSSAATEAVSESTTAAAAVESSTKALEMTLADVIFPRAQLHQVNAIDAILNLAENKEEKVVEATTQLVTEAATSVATEASSSAATEAATSAATEASSSAATEASTVAAEVATTAAIAVETTAAKVEETTSAAVVASESTQAAVESTTAAVELDEPELKLVVIVPKADHASAVQFNSVELSQANASVEVTTVAASTESSTVQVETSTHLEATTSTEAAVSSTEALQVAPLDPKAEDAVAAPALIEEEATSAGPISTSAAVVAESSSTVAAVETTKQAEESSVHAA